MTHKGFRDSLKMSFKGIAKLACCSFVYKWNKIKEKWLSKIEYLLVHITKNSWLDLCIWWVQTLKSCHQESVFSVLFLARPSFEWFHSQAGSPHAVADVQESHRLLAQHRGPQTIALESKPTWGLWAKENVCIFKSCKKCKDDDYVTVRKHGWQSWK